MIKTYFYNHSEQKMEHDMDLRNVHEFLRSNEDLLWIDLYNVSNQELRMVADIFNFHPLAIEDCLHHSPRAKIDNYEDYYFFVFHALRYHEESDTEITTVELNVFVGPNYVVTIHKRPMLSIGKIAKVSLKSKDYMNKGADYLLYSIVDGITDEYFPILDRISIRIDEIEDEMYDNRMEEVTEEFLALKRTLILIRRVILPQKRIFSPSYGQDPFPIQEQNLPFYIDLQDHLERIADSTETFKELVNSALDTYYSIVSAKTTEKLNILTLISTIMLPLTFITGFFGMNVPIPFQHSGYETLAITFFMIGLAVWMWWYLRKKFM
ncbi:magnesium transporter CorA family protein [Aneurinibacillus sp. Ricciae_BoGa-3]|uniref:magnesium transporter CorA family protein n=1 Tax=Aneurinibacillus sp. Ricciae_BoGa-3 TaxID=3022697 RepID=UPI002340FC78|nr:magnesium transporter CorA family protein [Aneurinibacillus sp. Ricciae_BoGa-3]WCK56195.1 magnesium transporter CorA family protein [Aneurinibacillus sp. Ricciae_BoGa-3]